MHVVLQHEEKRGETIHEAMVIAYTVSSASWFPHKTPWTCMLTSLLKYLLYFYINAFKCLFSWAFMGLSQKNEALVGQSVSFLTQSWTAVVVLGMIPHSCFSSLFDAVNNYLPCPFVSRELVEIGVELLELLNVVEFLHLSGVLWVLWSRRMKKFAGRCLCLAKNGLNTAVCLLDCWCAQLTAVAYFTLCRPVWHREPMKLLKMSLYQANEHLHFFFDCNVTRRD